MAMNDERSAWEKNLRFYTQTVDGEDGCRYDFTIMCNDKRLVVRVCPTSSSADKITHLITKYNEAFQDDDDKTVDEIQNEIEDVIYEAGWQQFARLAPSIETRPVSLSDILNPETFYFRLVINDGLASIVQENPPRGKGMFPCLSHIGITTLPHYSSSDILFSKKLMGTGFIAKVSVENRALCCKILTRTHAKAVQREYECLTAIATLGGTSRSRTPALHGFVLDDDTDRVIGILEEYIPHTMTLGACLKGKMGVDRARKAKWAKQIKGSVDWLHENDIVWGDGKPENIIINDETDDCHLIDFGGSWTDGWVDEPLKESKAGDEQALSKILNLLLA